MFKLNNLIALSFILFFTSVMAAPTAPIKAIHTQDLSEMIMVGKTLVILDARSTPYDDLTRIPGAKLLPYNTPENDIKEAIPGRDSMIVVYCTSTKCPASNYLAERLVRLGYKNVNKYQEGIVAWIAAGNPIEIDK